jgi:hypothetical protein
MFPLGFHLVSSVITNVVPHAKGRPQVLENRVQWRICGPKEKEMKAGGGGLHNEERCSP